MIVFTEYSDQLRPSSAVRNLRAATEAARLAGAEVIGILPDFSRCGDAEGALAHVRSRPERTPAAWVGYIPELPRYEAIHAAAAARNIFLLNDPLQHARVQELDRALRYLRELTPRTHVVGSLEECDSAAADLGFPIFVKGSVQSLKGEGYRACVARDAAELREAVRRALAAEERSRGRVLLRRFVRLRHSRESATGFPAGREYRVFVLRDTVVGLGAYWEGEDELAALLPEERQSVESLAKEAAARLQVPFAAIDVGQLEDGPWIVIETGDAQFSGACQTPLLSLWRGVVDGVARQS